MRTHSGERPFQCDICLRKFTLKHSMLRHQKKHNSHNNSQLNNVNSGSDMSDDETTTSGPGVTALSQQPTAQQILLMQQQHQQALMKMNLNISRSSEKVSNSWRTNANNTTTTAAITEEHLNKLNNNNININNNNISNNNNNISNNNNITNIIKTEKDSNDVESDLIGNLLGISDQGILNRVLHSSADEAAKLLGVDK